MQKEIAHIPWLVKSFHVDAELEQKIAALYPKKLSFGTRKGKWRIFERKDFSIPFLMEKEQTKSNGLCGVYYDKEGAQRLFSGELGEEKIEQLENKVIFYTTALELSDNVFEQRRFFAKPPKGLTYRAGNYYTDRGLLIAIALLVPAIAIMLRHELKEGVSSAGILAVTAGAEAVTGPIADHFIGKKKKREADLKRMEKIPEAISFLYGEKAGKKITREYSQLREEQRKHKIYDFAREAGYKVEKEFIEIAYNGIKSGNFAEIDAYLKRHKNSSLVPIMQQQIGGK